MVPCRNEARFIRGCLESILACDYPPDRLEALVVDGMSDDGTRAVVAEYVARRPELVRLLDNPQRMTPAALNTGIQHATGDVIVRMDAHAVYPADYVSRLVRWLQRTGADNVGGVCVTVPADGTPKARAIAGALAHPFGVGNAYFRIGSTRSRWVDTVPFGCFRRDVFDRAGLFDEELPRNQDDEFNARLIARGGRVLLVPRIESRYVARGSLQKLWQMYYEYGYFKPLVARKLGRISTARQLVPGTSILALAALAAVAPWSSLGRITLAATIGAYVSADVACSLHAGGHGGLRCVFWTAVAFPTMHAAYGLGFLKGAAVFLIGRRRTAGDVAPLPLSR